MSLTTMEQKTRLSMNTSLKNARIFDDDAWDEDNNPIVKKEIKEESKDEVAAMSSSTPLLTNIKLEPIERDSDRSLDEGELEDSMLQHTSSNKLKCKTPPTVKIKPDPDGPVDRLFDESPYNKELFKSFKIKEETPMKGESSTTDNEEPPRTRNSLKSVKRTVFSRLSPYKREESFSDYSKDLVKSRLGLKVPKEEDDEEEKAESIINAKKIGKKIFETDPEVIARREKQIAYGKNTMGYENYSEMVPRYKRTPEDPQTPPKFQKYSRRAWEGLIKQWRIKLHKYDPPEDST